MTTETYYITGTREFGSEFPLPAVTVTGEAKPYAYMNARHDAIWQAMNFWRSDDNGVWNGGRHGCGNIEFEAILIN